MATIDMPPTELIERPRKITLPGRLVVKGKAPLDAGEIDFMNEVFGIRVAEADQNDSEDDEIEPLKPVSYVERRCLPPEVASAALSRALARLH